MDLPELLRTSIHIGLLEIDAFAPQIPLVPKAVGADLRIIHRGCQTLVQDFDSPDVKHNETLTLFTCYREAFVVALCLPKISVVNKLQHDFAAIQKSNSIPDYHRTEGIPAGLSICTRSIKCLPYQPILVQLSRTKQLPMSTLVDAVIPAQKSLLDCLEHDITQDFRHQLASFSKAVGSVRKEHVPPKCQHPLAIYVAICKAFTKEIIQQGENPADFVSWWSKIDYPCLLDLFGQAVLIFGGVLKDESGDVGFALDYFANQVKSDFGKTQLRTGGIS